MPGSARSDLFQSQEWLKEQGFLVHYRESSEGLRVSPHFYNTVDEIERRTSLIGEWVRGGGEAPEAAAAQ